MQGEILQQAVQFRTGDLSTSTTGALTLNWGGMQARVLVDCAQPACDPTLDIIPAANLAAPGPILFDEIAHFLFPCLGSAGSRYRI